MLLSVLAAAAAIAVPSGDVLVAETSGSLRIVTRSGRPVRRLAWKLDGEAQAIELSRDRRHAYVSRWRADLPAELDVYDLATGARTLIADAVSPALSPDQRRLAYVSLRRENDITFRTALVVKTLRTGALQTIPIVPIDALGTPPELVVNWAPDGRHIALFSGKHVYLVDLARTTVIPSRGPPGLVYTFAPVYLSSTALVVQVGCCIGRQRLVVVDLDFRRRFAFATLSSPVEQVRRIGRGKLLIVTALHELAVVSRGRVRVIAHNVVAAAR